MRKMKIVGSGIYLPRQKVSSEQLAEELGVTEEAIINKSGVKFRYYANKEEAASWMGAEAAKAALQDAGIALDGINLILCASGSMEMPIPCTAALIHKHLGLKDTSIPAFDINATCLSFVASLDVISYLIDAGRYKNVLIISTEIASVGLNKKNLEVASLFGDGAAAFVVSHSGDSTSSIICSDMTTFSEGSHLCKIPGGGSGYPPQYWSPETAEQFQFHMSGKEIFKLASKQLPEFVNNLLKICKLKLEQIDVLIPHQASKASIRILGKKLGFCSKKVIDIIENYGNMIAASIPLALHFAIKGGQIKRGDRIMLLGTSAGLSIGGIVLTY